MKWHSHQICAALLPAALAGTLFAQTPQITFEQVEDVPHAISITQDHEGYMWIATQIGLAKYDGYKARYYTYDPADSTSLAFNRLEYVYVDRDGTLWVGTFGGGLDRFNPQSETFTHYRHDPNDPASLSNNIVTAILEDHQGHLWVGTHGGLNRLDRDTGRFTRYVHDPDDPTSLSDNQVRSIYEDRSGTLWIGTYDPHSAHTEPTLGGLNRFERSTKSFVRFLHDPNDDRSLISNIVRALFEDSQGRFWVGTWEGGLHVMDRDSSTFTRFRFDDSRQTWGWPKPQGDSIEVGVSFVHEDRQGNFWIGSVFGGLDLFDPDTGKSIRYQPDTADPYPFSAIWTIYESRDGTIWIGTWHSFFKINPTRSQLPFVELDRSPSYVVTSFAEDEEGHLWIGTAADGLLEYDRRKGIVQRFMHDPEDPASIGSNMAFNTLVDRQGSIWIGTDKGVDRLDRNSKRFDHFTYHPDDPLSLGPGSPIWHLYEDSEGTLWFGIFTGGLSRRGASDSGFVRFHYDPSDPNSLNGMETTSVLEDHAGTLWIGTRDGGLSRYLPESESFHRFGSGASDSDYLSDHAVHSLYATADEVLWIGTRTAGLNRLETPTGRVSVFNTSNSRFASNSINCITGDDEGFLWMSTLAPDITRFDPRQNSLQKYPVRWHSGWQGGCYRTRDGTLLFGTLGGFYAFKPRDLQMNPRPPEVRITDLRFLATTSRPPVRYDLSQPIRLRHNQNSFTIEFVGLHYAHPERNEYRFQLEGFDSEWRDGRISREATYTNLPHGRYVFRAKASNSDGIWNEEGAVLAITILPPWWRTWWAYGIYFLLLAGGVFAVHQSQRRRLIKQERERAAIREAELRAESAHERAAMLQHVDEVKSRFFANVSHEFRTPLTLILGPVADALRTGRVLDERQLDIVQRSARRLLRLINQLLELSRFDAGSMMIEPRHGDVGEFLRSVTLSFASRAEREMKMLTCSVEPECIRGGFDGDKLEKIVSNLLSNAFKFTPSGGKIALSARAESDSISITVRDTGPGIPKEEIPHLFDRFYQIDSSLSRRFQGSGIGLALVKELVELHGGTVAVESQVGFGTAFTVLLPLLDTADGDVEDNDSRGGDSPDDVDEALRSDIDAAEGGVERSYGLEAGRQVMEVEGPTADTEAGTSRALGSLPPLAPRKDRRPHILLVEDHDDVRAYVRNLLEDDYDVSEARDGLDGLAKAREHRPDLIIADVMMPAMDGLALTQAIRADTDINDVPIVLLTAKADLESRIEGLEEGADDYLAKPFDGEELLARAESLIEIRRRLRRKFSAEMLLGPSEIVATSDDAAFVERVREAIEAHMGDTGFGVEQLADDVALSGRQLQRRLKAITNLSPAGYIRMMRLARAAQLLEQQSGQISEIAYRVGYRDVGHFSQIFKQVYGVAPSAYGRVVS